MSEKNKKGHFLGYCAKQVHKIRPGYLLKNDTKRNLYQPYFTLFQKTHKNRISVSSNMDDRVSLQKQLTLSCWKSLLYRDQSTNLQSKSMD